MKLRYLAAIMLSLAGCTTVADRPAQPMIVQVSNGIGIIVDRDADGLWTATPKNPSAYRRWGIENAAKDGIRAIELHTGCRVDRNTLVSYNYNVRTGVRCPVSR